MDNYSLSIVVPCYNEEQVLKTFYLNLIKVIKDLKNITKFEVIFIDDGSKDKTKIIIKDLCKTHSSNSLISFSRNFGKESAILAGLRYSKYDLVVVMDADLQHPPALLPIMLKHIIEGYDVSTTKRISRKGEPIIRSIFAKEFYKIINSMSETTIEQGAQDYRMMTRKVVDSILSLKEYHRFSKGIFNWVGFNVKYIEMDNIQRVAGNSNWSFKSLFMYAIEGIIAFTTAPLRLATIMGIVVSTASFFYLMQIIIKVLIFGKDVPGYASIIVTILFMGGMQLLTIGIVSEYIAHMYLEVKGRPNFIIKEYIESDSDIKTKKSDEVIYRSV